MDQAEQLQLRLPRKPQEVDIETIRRQPSMTKAIELCVSLGGFKNDKDFCRAMDVDPPVWARIKAGQAAFHHDQLETLFDVCGNEVPLLWLVDRRGYYLRQKESELERRLRQEREANAELQKENDLLKRLVQGKA